MRDAEALLPLRQIRIKPKNGLHQQVQLHICSKAGARWGYFHPSGKRWEQQRIFIRKTRTTGREVLRNCGSTASLGFDQPYRGSRIALMGVNMRLADERHSPE